MVFTPLLCGTNDTVPHQIEFATLTTTKSIAMDKYDYMIPTSPQTYKQEQQAHIRLAVLELHLWKWIEADTDLSVVMPLESALQICTSMACSKTKTDTPHQKGREQWRCPLKQNELV